MSTHFCREATFRWASGERLVFITQLILNFVRMLLCLFVSPHKHNDLIEKSGFKKCDSKGIDNRFFFNSVFKLFLLGFYSVFQEVLGFKLVGFNKFWKKYSVRYSVGLLY